MREFLFVIGLFILALIIIRWEIREEIYNGVWPSIGRLRSEIKEIKEEIEKIKKKLKMK